LAIVNVATSADIATDADRAHLVCVLRYDRPSVGSDGHRTVITTESTSACHV